MRHLRPGPWFLAALLFGPAVTASSQTGPGAMGDYNTMDVEAGESESGFDGRIYRLYDGAKVRLYSDDPDKEPLPTSADTMTFSYPEEGGNQPSAILLERNVVVTHPEGTIRAEKADWDLEKGILVFTGNPVMSTALAGEIRGEKVTIDFNEDRVLISRIRIKEMRLGEGRDPSLLSETDVRDWPKFLDVLQTQRGADGPSPGKRIVALLDREAQDQIASATPEQLLANKKGVLKQINRVLANPRLYDKAAWEGIGLDKDTQDLLAKDELPARQQTRLNRLLLQAAYPDLIAKAPQQ